MACFFGNDARAYFHVVHERIVVRDEHIRVLGPVTGLWQEERMHKTFLYKGFIYNATPTRRGMCLHVWEENNELQNSSDEPP